MLLCVNDNKDILSDTGRKRSRAIYVSQKKYEKCKCILIYIYRYNKSHLYKNMLEKEHD